MFAVEDYVTEIDSESYGKTGADLIAEFIARHCHRHVFLVTGGACAFIIDAIAHNKTVDYVCFQHEQSAAMAADSIWRVSGEVGVAVATSGPGATNLITGIASSWFDSIPTLHITGQVNDSESIAFLGVDVRQGGFQETDIVAMVSPITKLAVQVHSVEELGQTLRNGLQLAISGRMGPVLVDVPINVQKELVPKNVWSDTLKAFEPDPDGEDVDWSFVDSFLLDAKRPLVVIGAGAALAGVAREVQVWCEDSGIPHVASWGAMPHLDRSSHLYQGTHGVYGSRVANWVVQASDRILVLGSRLDNRQRTGNPNAYAPFAKVLVVDIDPEELGKYKRQSNFQVLQADLKRWGNGPESQSQRQTTWLTWLNLLALRKQTTDPGTSAAVVTGELNPYDAIVALQARFPKETIVASDTGANLCWTYQAYRPDDSFIFTSYGNSPMGYSLPAAIGAQIALPDRPVWCFIGDGGLQMNIQELQTLVHHNLPIVIVVMNNSGYGIIKQFQDSYMDSRYEATGRGYSQPDFEKISTAYGIDYVRVKELSDIEEIDLSTLPLMVEVIISQGAMITPKTEMDRFLHDQFPYNQEMSDSGMPYQYPTRPSELPN